MNYSLIHSPVHAYPSKIFPGLLGEILDCLSVSGIASEIIGTQLLAFVSLLTQGVADVIWPNGVKVPVGANCLLIAPSGSGKTLIFKILSSPIEQYLLNLEAGDGSLKNIVLFIEDATKEAIIHSLRDCPVAGLFTDEAGQLKNLLKDSPTLVKLLDGSPLRSARVSTGRIDLHGHRFCMLVMGQPKVFEGPELLLGTGKGEVGLINRTFLARIGGHVAGSSLNQAKLSFSVKHAYTKKIQELLDATIAHIDTKAKERPSIALNVDAAKYLNELGNAARRNSEQGSKWFFIAEYLARHAERVLRLAGAFHVFEFGAKGEISLETVQRAAIIGDWYNEMFAQTAYVAPKQSKAEVDAAQLKDAFRQIYRDTGNTLFRQSDLRSSAVNIGLTPGRFDRALSVLGGQGSIRVVPHNSKLFVELNMRQFF